MPHLRVNTNVAKTLFDEAFIKQLCSSIATVMGKPEKVTFFLFCCWNLISTSTRTQKIWEIKLNIFESGNLHFVFFIYGKPLSM